MAADRLKFGREHRLLKRREFDRVYRSGRKAYGRHVMLLAAQRKDEGEAAGSWRLGMTVGRRSGNAVERNRQKRLAREYFRLNQSRIPEGWDFVLATRPSLNGAMYQDLARDLDGVFRRLGFPAPGACAREIASETAASGGAK